MYECPVPADIKKDISSTLKINFRLDKANVEEKETEDKYKVIASICTLGYDR